MTNSVMFLLEEFNPIIFGYMRELINILHAE